jgi:hypothetical protein
MYSISSIFGIFVWRLNLECTLTMSAFLLNYMRVTVAVKMKME